MLINKRVGGLVGVLAIAALSPALMAQDPKEGEGKELFSERCHVCHELTTVTVRRGTGQEWREIVDRMISYGAQVSEPEKETIVGYLTNNYGPDGAAAASSAHASVSAPN